MKLNENSKKVLEMIIKKGSGQVIEYLKEIVGIKEAYDLVDEIQDELDNHGLIGTQGIASGGTVAWITPKGRKYLEDITGRGLLQIVKKQIS
ncbi:MAG: hypothetical protein JXN63_04275 [Candidatus Delongbacteria bacterium]|nr:hypothetical protein [Candidatus Delongbacteria bacterium]